MELIYERLYEKEVVPPMTEEAEETISAKIPSFEEMIEKINLNVKVEPIPERKESSKEFVRTAVEVGDLYEFDTRIYQSDFKISVYYSFDSGGSGFGKMKSVLAMADDYDFHVNMLGRAMTLICDYYTHRVTFKARQYLPKIWD